MFRVKSVTCLTRRQCTILQSGNNFYAKWDVLTDAVVSIMTWWLRNTRKCVACYTSPSVMGRAAIVLNWDLNFATFLFVYWLSPLSLTRSPVLESPVCTCDIPGMLMSAQNCPWYTLRNKWFPFSSLIKHSVIERFKRLFCTFNSLDSRVNVKTIKIKYYNKYTSQNICLCGY